MKSKKPIQQEQDRAHPTLEEIRRRCSQIRASWTESQHLKRSGQAARRWQPPKVSIEDLLDLPSQDPERN